MVALFVTRYMMSTPEQRVIGPSQPCTANKSLGSDHGTRMTLKEGAHKKLTAYDLTQDGAPSIAIGRDLFPSKRRR